MVIDIRLSNGEVISMLEDFVTDFETRCDIYGICPVVGFVQYDFGACCAALWYRIVNKLSCRSLVCIPALEDKCYLSLSVFSGCQVIFKYFLDGQQFGFEIHVLNKALMIFCFNIMLACNRNNIACS